jgi:hypothetical protein
MDEAAVRAVARSIQQRRYEIGKASEQDLQGSGGDPGTNPPKPV